MIGTYEGEEYEIIEVPMKQVPSRQNHEEWRYKARCRWDREWIWYSFEGYKITGCRHIAGFRPGTVVLKRRRGES